MLTGSPAVASWLTAASQEFEDHLLELDSLDAAIGDGDHGTNMARGLTTAATIPPEADQSAAAHLGKVGLALVSSVGGASGPLYGTFFLKVGQLWASPPSVPAIATALRAGLASIQARGRAVPGDATIVDALDPAVAALEAADPTDLPGALRTAVAAAHAGAEATADMVSRRGRAAHFGQASLGHVDPGARSMALLLDSAARHVICAVSDQK
ncbi:MAG: dihydroxyacetone kinase subunit DhaL [Arachnia propionica]|uniref:dihydroxyacetone kinase subunit DhaL n=1 Tax=Arachnia propionica TaxID=1750 RepID=UPI0026F98BD1|nr:dihydroxyacetone kinase subunit DhaL [Arachnia propionica]